MAMSLAIMSLSSEYICMEIEIMPIAVEVGHRRKETDLELEMEQLA